MAEDAYSLIEKAIIKYDDPEKAAILIDQLRKTLPPETDRWNLRNAIWAFMLIAGATPIYSIMLAIYQIIEGEAVNVTIPDALLTLSSTALGALASYVTPFTKQRQNTSNAGDPTPPRSTSPRPGPDRAGPTGPGPATPSGNS